MATVIESGIGTINYGTQTAKGTIATAATTTAGYNRPRWVSGALRTGKTLGSEEYVDGQRFASPSVYTDRVGGEVGELVIQVQPNSGALFAAQLLGIDTVTGAADPYTHTITSAGTSGGWGTWWQKVGAAVGPNREAYVDSKIASLVMECGAEQKVMHYTLGIQALTAGLKYDTDPSKTEDSDDPYLFTEAEGAISLDSTVVSDVRGEVLDVQTNMAPFYGDAIAPTQLIEGKGTIVRTVQTIVTDDTLKKYYKATYGTDAPAADAEPVKDVLLAAVTSTYTRSATRKITYTTPKVAIDPADIQIAPLPEGGPIEIDFTGNCRKDGATPALSIVALTGDSLALA